MAHEPPTDTEVEGWLKTLGVESLCQWDVLAFLYRHPTSLVGAEHIARLVGYPAEPVVAALDVLESQGLVERSRVSQNVRMHQFTVPAGPLRREALERLQAVAENRGGRPLLSEHLRRSERPPKVGLEAIRRFPEEPHEIVRTAKQQSRQPGEGRKTWLRAI
jgi:DNA-binding MarR family transcriptional regulator